MVYDVKVKIDLAKPIGSVGFGHPLILVENASKAVPYTEVTDVSAVATAGFATETDVYKAVQLIFAQVNAPKTVAICAVAEAATAALADPALIGKGWRQLIVINDGETASTPSALAAAVESLEGKMLFIGLDTDAETAPTVSGLRRTVLFFCDATEEVPVPVAALVGEVAGREVGSFTYKNLILSGISAQDLSDAEIKAIHGKGGMTFVEKAGDGVTSEGKVAGGEYIDVIDAEDYIIHQITWKMQKALNNAAKVPYTNNGISMLETVVVTVLQSAFNSGMIATTEDGGADYSVTFGLREDTTEEDRSNRKYVGGSFRFALAGAIHEADIIGEITV